MTFSLAFAALDTRKHETFMRLDTLEVRLRPPSFVKRHSQLSAHDARLGAQLHAESMPGSPQGEASLLCNPVWGRHTRASTPSTSSSRIVLHLKASKSVSAAQSTRAAQAHMPDGLNKGDNRGLNTATHLAF
eukprot:4431922-Amphidinium_carterae.1